MSLLLTRNWSGYADCHAYKMVEGCIFIVFVLIVIVAGGEVYSSCMFCYTFEAGRTV